MSTITHRTAATAASVTGPSGGLTPRLSRIYGLAQNSDFLFGSPLGPFYAGDRPLDVPHFVYFGPLTSQESLRLAIYAGAAEGDLPAARALLAYVERLARQAEIGHGLNLSYFPVVNVLTLLGGAAPGRDLANEHWGRSREPEITLLAQDARARGYQGFVRFASGAGAAPSVSVRIVCSAAIPPSAAPLFTSEDFLGWPVRQQHLLAADVASGPLTLAEDLPFVPFEVEVVLPRRWSQAETDRVLARVLRHFIIRYRASQAYAQHL